MHGCFLTLELRVQLRRPHTSSPPIRSQEERVSLHLDLVSRCIFSSRRLTARPERHIGSASSHKRRSSDTVCCFRVSVQTRGIWVACHLSLPAGRRRSFQSDPQTRPPPAAAAVMAVLAFRLGINICSQPAFDY